MVWLMVAAVVAFAAGVGFVLGRVRRSVLPRTAESTSAGFPRLLIRISWLALPFVLCAVIALVGRARGYETGPLWAVFGALVIIQAVVAGMFGLSTDTVSSIVSGIFVAVGLLLIGGIFLFVVLDWGDYFVPYLMGGIGAIVACTVFAAQQSLR